MSSNSVCHHQANVVRVDVWMGSPIPIFYLTLLACYGLCAVCAYIPTYTFAIRTNRRMAVANEWKK